MRTVEINLYQFDELGDKAKEKARDWYREGANESPLDACSDNFETVCAILGIKLKTFAVKLMSGNTRQDSCIFFSGFYSQGDGACFEATYTFAAHAQKLIRQHAPGDSELARIADVLADEQARNGNVLSAVIAKSSYFYSHEYTVSVVVELPDDTGAADVVDSEVLPEAFRDLMRWMYRQLKAGYEDSQSDEIVDDNIRMNEYEYDVLGNRA